MVLIKMESILREAEKKSSSPNGRAIKRGGGGKGQGHLGKKIFFKPFFPTFQRLLSSRGEGG